ncbi:hypothetical protein A0J61_11301 [Choanephora cucurbitarum]|uniref:Uncharacterized protein n=1 Tax=Choanephora cucurbitarum TaxID=101091 RepID=A0A1C7MV10_9FUNG|nr:hypothetical protein A0J61_11301 [Choanephora cucurbitarum]
MAKEIRSTLGNQDRENYQLNATKASLGISKSTDFLGDLSKIKKKNTKATLPMHGLPMTRTS